MKKLLKIFIVLGFIIGSHAHTLAQPSVGPPPGGGGSGGGGGQIGEVLQVIEPTDGAPLPGRNDAPIFRGNIK